MRVVKDRETFSAGGEFELETDGSHLIRVVASIETNVEAEAYDRDNDRWISFYDQADQSHDIDPVGPKVRLTVADGDGIAQSYTEKVRS